MQVLLAYLLKWRLQPKRRSRSWHSTIVAQRLEVAALLEQSPSLEPRLSSELGRNYAGAVKRAMSESGLKKERFPKSCPFALTQILDEDYLPD